MGEYTIEQIKEQIVNAKKDRSDPLTIGMLRAYADMLERPQSMVTGLTDKGARYCVYGDSRNVELLSDYLARLENPASAKGRIDFKGMWNAMSDAAAAPQPPKVQPIDLQAVREVVADLKFYNSNWSHALSDKLSRVIGGTP